MEYFLVDTYDKYKKDTNAFVNWLASTARSTGKVEDIFQPTNAGQGGGRLKGKARKAATKKERRSFQIALKHFTRLAEAIVTAGIKVPRYVLAILRDALRARREFAVFYKHQEADADGKLEAANKSHAHFIAILEQIFRLLAATVQPSSHHGGKAAEDAPGKGTELANMFEILDLEELSEPGEPMAQPVQESKEDSCIYTIEPLSLDICFAAYCFLKDLTDIRVYVSNCWRQYTLAQMTLATAATIMNTAISVMRRLSDAFLEEFPQFEQHHNIMNFLFEGYCDPKVQEAYEASSSGNLVTYQAEGISLSKNEFFCYYTHLLLQDAFEGGLSFFNVDHKCQMTENEETLFKTVTIWNLIEKNFSSRSADMRKESYISADQYLGVVRVLQEVKRKVPTWAVFAIQLFIDTRRELGEKVSCGLEDFQRHVTWMTRSTERYLEAMEPYATEDWKKTGKTPLTESARIMKAFAFQDVVQEYLDSGLRRAGKSSNAQWGEFFLMKQHPMLCGILLQEFLAKFHQDGIQVAEIPRILPVRSAIQLYNAAHVSGHLRRGDRWADLEYIIEKHGEAWVFQGDRPTTLIACERSITSSFGTGTIYDEPGDTRLATKRTDQVQRKLNRPLRQMSRYGQLWESVPDAPVRKSRFLTRASEDPSVMLEQLVSRWLELEDHSQPANPRPKTKKQTQARTPMQSLIVFEKALKADEFALQFDMMALNSRCLDLFERIYKLPTDRLGYTPRDFLEHLIRILSRRKESESTGVTQICELLGETVTKEGNIEYLAAEARRGVVSGAYMAVQEQDKRFQIPAAEKRPVVVGDDKDETIFWLDENF